MAPRCEHHCASGRSRRGEARFWLAAAFSSALLCILPGIAAAQQPATVVVATGNAAVTGFSGAVPPIQIAPGVDPSEQTFIDLHGPSLRVVDLQHMRGPAAAQLVGAPKLFTFNAAQIGQVFGVALDDNSPSNIYVAASSAYGLPIVAPGADGKLQHIKTGAPKAAFMAGLWGPNGGPGSIWKIDGVTGAVSLFANVSLDGRTNAGPALGGLAFDPGSKSLFVADRETGLIHRFAMNGRELGWYDHGVTGRKAQGLSPEPWNQQRLDIGAPEFDSLQPYTWNYAAPERRVFGVAVYDHRLYYSVADSLQIWSVGLKPDGSFDTDAVIELAVPPSSGPTEISKITFDEQGRMFLAERPAPTGAYDFEALSVPAIGRVLRYARVGVTADGRHIWQEIPDQYAIGFPRDLRNANGGVAIGYNYDRNGEMIRASCGGFVWSTGEDLRDTSDAALAARLSQSGPLHVDGLQGNGTWRIRRDHDPPLNSYFIAYLDESDDASARGHMGDIDIERACASPPPSGLRSGGPSPPQGGGAPGTPGVPLRHTGTPPPPPWIPSPPPGGCLPNQLRDASTGQCGGCARPNIQVNGTCCSVATLAANAACSNSSCQQGQTPIGPSNFCCNGNQVYTNAAGAQACCSRPLVNGQCQPSIPPINPSCQIGYVPIGGSCCLASQATSIGTCCPAGQTPGGPNKSQCIPLIPVNIPQLCCSPGQIPVGGPMSCCAAANVTTIGVCCSQPVDPRNRTNCPAQTQIVPGCAAGYTKMPDGNCCNDRFVSRDGKSCNTRSTPCGRGEFRDASGACAPVAGAPPQPCAPGEVLDRNGNCIIGGAVPTVPPACALGEMLDRRGHCVTVGGPPGCPPGEVRDRRGHCVTAGGPPGCPRGEARDRRGRCVSAGGPPHACPAGQVLDRRGRCVSTALPFRGPPGPSFGPRFGGPGGGGLGGPGGPGIGRFGPGGGGFGPGGGGGFGPGGGFHR
jgi:hypothetical protein